MKKRLVALPFLLTACTSVPPKEEAATLEAGMAVVSAHSPDSAADQEPDGDPDAQLEQMIASGRFNPKPADAGQLISSAAASYSTRMRGARLQRAIKERATAEIYIFSMGQADSMLVVGPPPSRKTMLVDVGEMSWNTRRGCLHVRERVKEITGQYHVDYLVLTHYHQDHAGAPPGTVDNEKRAEGGGIFCLMGSSPEFFSVGTFIDSGVPSGKYMPKATPSLDGIRNHAGGWISSGALGRHETARHGRGQIDLGQGMGVEILVTNGKVTAAGPEVHAAVEAGRPGTYSLVNVASANDFSIGMEISVGEFDLFTAGDLSGAPEEDPDADFSIREENNQVYTNVEKPLSHLWSSEQRKSQVEVYRVSHHGSGNSSAQELVDMLRPQLVIYSVGGRYGHPSDAVLERLNDLGADQLITTSADRDDGTIPAEFGGGWENPAGEVRIVVPVDGAEYNVITDTQAFTYPVHRN